MAVYSAYDDNAVVFQYFGYWYEILDEGKKEVALIQAHSAPAKCIIPKKVEYNEQLYTVTKIRYCKEERWVTVQPEDKRKKSYQEKKVCSSTPFTKWKWGCGIWENNEKIKEIVLPSTITVIGGNAFCCCTSLTSIEIPNSVTSIGGYAFYGCKGLTSIEIPNSVTGIGDYAFYCCKGLTGIEIPNSVTSIGEHAFYDCSGLTSVVIPNSVTSIGKWAFYGCKGLTSVVIPSSVEKIHECAFGEIPNLQVDIYNEEGEVLIDPNAFRGDAKINYLGKKKVKEDKTTKVEKTSNETIDKKEEQAPVIDLDKLIDAVVADGVITDKERSVILKKATAAGYDADEVEILLDGKLAEKQNAEKVVTKEPKKAPAKKEAAPVTEVVTPEEKSGEGGRNYSKYSVNGEGSYGKGRMVEAVVNKYVELNPGTTVQKLKEVFPEHLQGSNFIKDSTETITDMKRYYEATLPSGAKFYISNQWGTQTDAFMEYVNNCVDGITVTKL